VLGFSVKFNWVLQIAPPAGLEVGREYDFSKFGNRVFPVDTPIDLIDVSRQAVAKIKVRSFTNTNDSTSGVFEVIKLYSGDEKTVLTNYWIENQ
jgi:hypothetical protein